MAAQMACVNAAVDKRPRISLHVVGREVGPRHIVITERPWRSKYATLVCFCKRRRKNGTCQRTDPLIALLIHPERARIKHPEIDDTIHRVPARGA